MTEPADRKCIINNCENHADQGRFVGSLCSPCHRFLSGEDERHSQADRNIRLAVERAVEAEREACAKVCDQKELANLYGHRVCADAIRARGEK